MPQGPVTVTVRFSPELRAWMELAGLLQAFMEDVAESQPWNEQEALDLIEQLRTFITDTIEQSN